MEKILNLGSRNNFMGNAINIDMEHFHFQPIGTQYICADVMEIDRLFQAGTIDKIYASHIFEHLTHAQIPNLLYKCWALLKPGGHIEITVPDFYALMIHYKGKHESGDFDDIDIMNIKFFDVAEETNHKTIWYKEIGVFYLTRENFFKIEKIISGAQGNCPSDIQITFIAKKL